MASESLSRKPIGLSGFTLASAATIVLLKDFFRILEFHIGINLNYVLAPIAAVLLIIFLARLLFDEIHPVFLHIAIFLLGLIAIFLVHVALGNPYQYSIANSLQYIFIALFVPLCFLGAAATEPADAIRAIRTTLAVVTVLTFIAAYGTTIALILNRDAVVNYFMALLQADAIVNPIQSYSDGYELRISGIFRSSLTLAMVANAAIASVLFSDLKKRLKFFLTILLLPVVGISLNRNGMGVCAILVGLYLVRQYSPRMCLAITRFLVLATIASAIMIPLFLTLIPLSSLNVSDTGALTKLSTLVSRADAWLLVFQPDNWLFPLFGTGFVQGLSESQLYVDNNFYYLIFHGGAIIGILFCAVLLRIASFIDSPSRTPARIDNSRLLRNALFSAGVVSMLLNNTFFEPTFFLFFVAFPLALAAADLRQVRQSDMVKYGA